MASAESMFSISLPSFHITAAPQELDDNVQFHKKTKGGNLFAFDSSE